MWLTMYQGNSKMTDGYRLRYITVDLTEYPNLGRSCQKEKIRLPCYENPDYETMLLEYAKKLLEENFDE